MAKFLSFLDEHPTLKGLILMLTSVFLIAVMNACAKLASAYHDPIEVVFYRGVIGISIMLSWLVFTGDYHRLYTDRPLAHAGRSLIGTASVCCVFWAYSLLPMSNVTAILLTSSIHVAILSGPLLGERMGPWRWGAVIVGLCGALIVASPSGHDFNLTGTIVAFIASVTISIVTIFLRSMGKTEDAFTTVFYFSLVGTSLSGLYMIFNGHAPSIPALLPLLGTGLASIISLILKTEAYKYGEVNYLAPCQYTAVIWAALLGFLFFGDTPTSNVIIGSSIIVAANLLIMWRENIHKRRKEISAEQTEETELD